MVTDAEHKRVAQDVGILIAKALMLVDTDYRGNALLAAANELKTHAQSYTGKLLLKASNDYGMMGHE